MKPAGQKNKLTRRWARRGIRRGRPATSAPNGPISSGDQSRAKGKGAGLVMPWCDPTLWPHLNRDQCRFRSRRPCGADRRSGRLALDAQAAIPVNITVLALPPRSPELNPVENVWQFMRDNWFRTGSCKTKTSSRCAPSLEQPHATMEDHVGMRKWRACWHADKPTHFPSG